MTSPKSQLLGALFCTIAIGACATTVKPTNNVKIGKKLALICHGLVFKSAASAWQSKKDDVPKEKLSKATKESWKNKNEPFKSMSEIPDEIYDFSSINQSIYSTYKAELCFRRITNQNLINDDFSVNHPKLIKCGELEKAQQISCAMSVTGTKIPYKAN